MFVTSPLTDVYIQGTSGFLKGVWEKGPIRLLSLRIYRQYRCPPEAWNHFFQQLQPFPLQGRALVSVTPEILPSGLAMFEYDPTGNRGSRYNSKNNRNGLRPCVKRAHYDG